MPPAVALGLGLMVAAGLALVFPYRSIEDELARAARLADPLQIAYLRAWLTVRPERAALRITLAEQLANAGDINGARGELQALRQTAEPRLRERALLLELDIDSAELAALPPSDPRRGELHAALQARLLLIAQQRQAAAVGDLDFELARRATALQADPAARALYARLLAGNARLSSQGWEEAARTMLAAGDGEFAAQLYLAARSAATGRSESRRLYLAALRALQGAGRLARALEVAERELGTLATDTETLEFLTRLALAANRPDLAQRYAQMLLKLSLLPAAIEALRATGQAVPPEWLAVLARLPPRLLAAQAADGDALKRTPGLPYDERLYTLAYDVFIANGNLADAIAVARAAVRQVPGDARWRRRLAQAADWAGEATLALEQWHALALASGDPQAWAEVQRRAPQLNDSERWLQALQFAQRRRPDDLALVRQLVAAYEAQGKPERAVELLRQVPRGADPTERRQRLELLAEVAERSGRDRLRKDTLESLLRDYGPRTHYALGLAQLAWQAGDYEAAWRVLSRAVATTPAPVTSDDPVRDFWEAYAEAALATGRQRDAERSLRLLVASPNATQGEFMALIALLEEQQPLAAADFAEQAHARFDATFLAIQALALRAEHGSAAEVRAFIARLTPQQRARLQRQPQFLLQLAAFHLRVDEPHLAVQAARQVLALDAQAVQARAILLWALLQTRDAAAVRTELLAHPDAPRTAPQLAAPYAAAWLALHEPRRALHYLRPLAAREDPLWLTAAADAYEQLGQTEVAWQLRRLAWIAPRDVAAADATPNPVDRAERLQEARRRLALASTFATGDDARLQLQVLLRDDPAGGAGDSREAVLGYAINRSLTETAQLWLQQHYRASTRRPEWAELSVALAEDDRTRIAALLDTAADWLPMADRVEGSARVRRYDAAQTLAFDGLQRMPDNEALHQRLVEQTLALPQPAPAAGLTGGGFRQRPLEERSVVLEGSVPLGSAHWLRASAGVAERRSTDTTVFLDPPTERSVTLAAGPVSQADRDWQLGLQQRDALASTTGVRADGRWQATPRLQLAGAAGIGQPITDNAVLRAGGQRDLAEIALQVRPSLREFGAVAATFSRIDAQGGGRVGTSQVLRAEVGHRLRIEYPDLAVRLTYSDLRYSAADGVAAPLLALVPAEQRPFVTNADLLPASTTQWAVRLSCGESVVSTYSRGWRLVCGVALTQDAASGSGNEWLIGARGSAFGTDQLWLGASGGTSRGANTTPYTELTLAYRYYF